MTAGFDVDAGHLAGFADMTKELSEQADSLGSHVASEACTDTGYTGLKEPVQPHVDC